MQMGPFSALLALCAGNSPVTDEFPAQWPVTRSFDVFFDLRLNKRLSKQSQGWWFETLSWSLWRQSNEYSVDTFTFSDKPMSDEELRRLLDNTQVYSTLSQSAERMIHLQNLITQIQRSCALAAQEIARADSEAERMRKMVEEAKSQVGLQIMRNRNIRYVRFTLPVYQLIYIGWPVSKGCQKLWPAHDIFPSNWFHLVSLRLLMFFDSLVFLNTRSCSIDGVDYTYKSHNLSDKYWWICITNQPR